MILLDLFLTFLTIGAVSFGGGYGMISLIRESVVHHGWLTEEAFMSFVAVSEATPGPLAVNMATFVGSSQAGIPGALAATIGVVLPSFLIILLIAAVISNLLKYRGVQAALSGIRPCVVGLILSTAITLGLKTLLGFSGVGGRLCAQYQRTHHLCHSDLHRPDPASTGQKRPLPHSDDPAVCRTWHRLLRLYVNVSFIITYKSAGFIDTISVFP